MKTCNKFFAELFGTFVLVFGGCGTALFGHVGFLGVAIAFGLTVVAMAYGIGWHHRWCPAARDLESHRR